MGDHDPFDYNDIFNEFLDVEVEVEEEDDQKTKTPEDTKLGLVDFQYNDKITNVVNMLTSSFAILTKNMKDDVEKRVSLVLFLEKAFVACNTEEPIIGGGGKFGEIIAAYQRGCIMNTKMTGVDMVHAKTGEPQEQKTSTTAAGKKANFNFTIPARATPSTTDTEYKKAVISTFLAKGDVFFTHNKPKSQETHNYRLSKEFLAELMWHKCNTNKTLRVNLGAMPCKECKLIHRMVHFMQLDQEWKKLKDKSTFDWSRTDEEIPSSTFCKKYQMPKNK